MSIAETYPTINAHIEGNLKPLWEELRQNRIDDNPKLSPARAGELAAAHLIREYGNEAVALEQDVRQRCLELDEETIQFYDDYVEATNTCTPAELVTAWSGTRTLIDDVHFA